MFVISQSMLLVLFPLKMYLWDVAKSAKKKVTLDEITEGEDDQVGSSIFIIVFIVTKHDVGLIFGRRIFSRKNQHLKDRAPGHKNLTQIMTSMKSMTMIMLKITLTMAKKIT